LSPFYDNYSGSIVTGTGARGLFWVALVFSGLTVGGALILGSLPGLLFSLDVIPVTAVIFSFMGGLYWALASSAAADDPTRIAFRSVLVIWMFLLVSEELFSRSSGDLGSVLRERFSVAAYGEFGLWIVSFLVLLLISLRSPRYLRHAFSAQYRWVSVLSVFCMVSTVQSPQPLYCMAWAFKLCLVVWLLAICHTLMRDSCDLIVFIKATFWACLFYLVVEVYLGFANPASAFEGGRFGQSSNSLSVIAGAVLILSLALRRVMGSICSFSVSLFAASIMILAGGKAGIVSGALSAMVFYLTKNKVGSAVALLVGIVCLGLVLSMFTPLGSYFDAYANEGGADTLTGRTDLWFAALPLIRQHLILGHGYLSSRFAAPQLDWGRPGARWEADHMHNAFLDIVYNNGLVGLSLVLILHAVIIKNPLHVMKYPATPRTLYDVASGSLALYTNLVISAFFNSTIGGRPSTLFMLFLALFVVGESLAKKQNKHGTCVPACFTDSPSS
jgi:O-antigen ligase